MKNIVQIALLGWVLSWLAVPGGTLAARSHSSPIGSPVYQEERFSRQFDIGAEGSFTLTNVSGEIVVRGGSGDQLQVEAVKRVHDARAVEPVVAARQREAHEVGLAERLKVRRNQRVQCDRAVVVERVAVAVDDFGVRGDRIDGDIADDLEHAAAVKGSTLPCLRMYWKRGRVKVEIGVGKGKTHADQRHDLKKKVELREAQREVARFNKG